MGDVDAPHRVTVEPCAKRFRVYLGDAAIADSVAARLLFETGHQPVIYFPPADVAMDRLTPTPHRTHCPWKGEAAYWTVSAGAKQMENAAWSYRRPLPAAADIAGYVSFEWSRVGRWMEEDQPLLGHARDPHKRIDTLPTTRRVVVRAGAQVLADSRAAVLLFETGLPVRPYLDRADVAMHLLRPSPTRTVCPYKGIASYYDAAIGGTVIRDAVWCYEDPFPEVGLIKGRLAFYPERVDTLEIAAR